jgi:hypothetical protein
MLSFVLRFVVILLSFSWCVIFQTEFSLLPSGNTCFKGVWLPLLNTLSDQSSLSSPSLFYAEMKARPWSDEFPGGQQADAFSFLQHVYNDFHDLEQALSLELCSTVTCGNCRAVTATTETSCGLSLALPEKSPAAMTVRSLFAYLCKPSPIELFHCDTCCAENGNGAQCRALETPCTGRQQASRVYSVKTWPSLLIVCLRRFTPLGRKSGRQIDVNGGIDRFTVVDYAVHHDGSTVTGGHFWAAWRYSDTAAFPFWRLDDQKPTPRAPQPMRMTQADALDPKTIYVVVYSIPEAVKP